MNKKTGILFFFQAFIFIFSLFLLNNNYLRAENDIELSTFLPSDSSKVKEDTVLIFVEIMPSFPGGDAALMKYLSENIKYPVIAQQFGIQGNVVCEFVINREGKITDIKIVRSVDKSLDAEAIRVISRMPRWSPGVQKGEKVRVKYTLPVNFRLQ